MQPFSPAAHSTASVSLGATVQTVAISSRAQQVWIDNRGSTDVLVEYYDSPTDADSFRIAGGCAQPLTLPRTGGSWDGSIRIKRPAGSSAEAVYVSAGTGV